MTTKDRTQSAWDSFELPSFGRVNQNLLTDICIVGGGITGITLAYELGRRGHKVLLVEAFSLGSGQTSRTTAHLTCELESSFQELLKIHDEKTVGLFYEAHKKAIDIIEENIRRENIDCDFKRLDGYLFCGDQEKEDFHKELEAALKCGADLEFSKTTPLLNNSVSSLIYKNQARFHPLKYLAGLIESMKKFDVTLYEGTHIQDMSQDDRETWTLLTDTGFEISAHSLVVATNTPVNNRFHIHTRQFPYRTYAVAFSLTGDVPQEDCLLWDTEDPYHYIRFADDKLIVGGEDHRVGEMPEEDPFVRIDNWARSKFSFIGEVVHKWSGQIYEPADGIGFIGINPGLEKNVYISTGESGIGMTSSAIASQIIPDLIEKKHNDWAPVFDPTRLPTRGMKELLKENISTVKHYAEWVMPSEVDSLQEIPQDGGGVRREGLLKTCYYHDAGHFERKSAVCTHLGGIVHWNDIEKTWDCPCHGSRFNTRGKVIEGPATSDLMEKE